MSSEQPSQQQYSVNDLAFRAACNAAAAESKRPLRRRVIERLATSPDTRALISELRPRESDAPGGLLDQLANDARWNTLVAETTADTLGWDDLASQGASWGERAVTIWRKFMEGDDQHVARIVTATVVSIGAVWSGNQITHGELLRDVVLPIRATLAGSPELDMKFKISADGATIPVSFVPADEGMSIPVELDVQAKREPIVVDIATGKTDIYMKELARVLEQLREVNATLAGIVKVSGGDASQFAKLGEMESHLRRVVDLQTNIVEAGAGQRSDVTLDEDRPRMLLVQSLDRATGAYRAANVVMCLDTVDKPKGQAKAKFAIWPAGEQGGCSGGEWITEGQAEPRSVGADNWIVTVHSVKRRLNGQGRATFSLRPDIAALRKVMTVDTTD